MPNQPIDDLFADDSAQPTALPLGVQAVLLRLERTEHAAP